MMKWFAVACVLVSLAGVVEMEATGCTPGSDDPSCQEIEDNIEPTRGPECLAGTKWRSKCNHCRCTPKGRTVCTEYNCDHDLEVGGEHPKFCKPNTRWLNGCSYCFCSISGNALCSNKTRDCEHIPDNLLNDQSEVMSGTTCSTGTTWKTNCHHCSCNSSGLHECTKRSDATCHETELTQKCAPNSAWLKYCNKCWCVKGSSLCTTFNCYMQMHVLHYDEYVARTRWTRDTMLQETVAAKGICAPGSSFRSGCNNCLCADDGKSFKCTHNECMDTETGDVEVFMDPKGEDHIQRHSICQPNTTFKVNCNTCFCNDLGTDLKCTNKDCPGSDDVELFHELKDRSRIVPMKRAESIAIPPVLIEAEENL